MRKLLIATVLLVLLITGLYLALPTIAEYSVRQALEAQQIDAQFELQRPGFNRIELHQLKLEKNTPEQSFRLTAEAISLSFSPWQLFNTGRINTLDMDAVKLDLTLHSQITDTDQDSTALQLDFPPLPSYILSQIPAEHINLSHYSAVITVEGNQPARFAFSGSASANNEQLTLSVDQLDNAPEMRLTLMLDQTDKAALSIYAGEAIALKTAASLSYQQQQLEIVSQTSLYPEQWHTLLQLPLIQTFLAWPEIPTVISGTVMLEGSSQIPLNDLSSALHQYHLKSQLTITQLADLSRLYFPSLHLKELAMQQDANLTLNHDDLTLRINSFTVNGQQLELKPEPNQISTATMGVNLLNPLTVTTSIEQLSQSLADIQLPDTQLQIELAPVTLKIAGQPKITLQTKPLKLALSQINLNEVSFQANLIANSLTGHYGEQVLPQLSLTSLASISPAKITNRFDIQLQDPLLAADTQINGSTTTVTATGVTTGHWQTALPLTGIEKLIRRYTQALPPELVFTAGTLKQQGWLDMNQTGIALRLLNKTEQANLSYDQTHLYDINWHSETIKNHRGKLDDNGELNVAFIDVGVPLENFSGRYRFERSIAGKSLVQLSSNTVDLLGGTVTTLPLTLSLDNPHFTTAVAVTGIDLGQLIALEQQEGLTGSGTLNGQMPIRVSNGEFSITGGQIISTSEGGWIRYAPQPEVLALTETNQALGVAFDALTNMHYDSLGIELDYYPDGEALLKTHLKGRNPSWNSAQPVDFTINIEENIPKLLQALQFTDKLTKSLEKRYR
ncbi:hypothetical protein EH243_14775 [Amphritea opalescens]|uniref:Uncharacterized protein n=1 Tax=Amphritea opalescens TaxID=2490544 RepID=A0A430KN99_9GAMM|nr:YdbH domain-containing protein [Amphritea opalescens]RTE64936.1 hypothetical protein EH243_14775 [Amphritea opalescens]